MHSRHTEKTVFLVVTHLLVNHLQASPRDLSRDYREKIQLAPYPLGHPASSYHWVTGSLSNNNVDGDGEGYENVTRIRAASNFIALIPPRLLRQVMAMFLKEFTKF